MAYREMCEPKRYANSGFEFWRSGIARKWVGRTQSLSPVIKIYWERDSKNNGETSQDLQ